MVMRLIDADALIEKMKDCGFSTAQELMANAFCFAALKSESLAPTIGGWISVKDRLPEENVAVNIVWVNTSPESYYRHIKDKPFVATGVYFRGAWYWWSSVVQDYIAEYGVGYTDKMDEGITVTHWMPLPEPPKEGEA